MVTKERGKPILRKRELFEETIIKVEDATGNILIEIGGEIPPIFIF